MTLNKGIFTAGVVSAMVAAPYVADELNLTQDTASGEDGFSLADVISMKEAAAFAGGTGTVEDPYLVSTVDDLRAMANNLTAHYKLVNDINLGNVLWTPIGNTSNPFTGSLDGGNHTISNLNILVDDTVNGSQTPAGLFGKAAKASFQNIKINGVTISVPNRAVSYTGTLFGEGTAIKKLENIHVTNSTIEVYKQYAGSESRNGAVGGIFGNVTVVDGSNHSNLTFDGTILAANNDVGGIGGLVSGNQSISTFSNLSSSGLVTNLYKSGQAGGVFGQLRNNLHVENIVSDMDVESGGRAAGLIGSVGLEALENVKVVRAIAYGSVKSTNESQRTAGTFADVSANSKFRLIYAFNEKVEGLSGNEYVYKASYPGTSSLHEKYSFAYETIVGTGNSDSIGDVITKEEVFKKSTYELLGFDFDNTWTMEEGSSAPRLKIQEIDTTMKHSQEDVEKYSFAGGSGTILDPYLVSTLDDVRLMQNNPTSHFKLINDIDLARMLLEPIGTYKVPFTGSLDGNGFKLKNLNINSTKQYTGLFGYMKNALVKNLTIENGSVVSNQNYTGFIAGYADNATFTNIRIVGNDLTLEGKNYVGGVAGYSAGTTNSSKIEVHGEIKGAGYLGGLTGSINGGLHSELSIHANVTGTGQNVGGVFGDLFTGSIEDVIVYGDVKGGSLVGGLGNMYVSQKDFKTRTINRAIVYGSVSGTNPTSSASIGGLLGGGNTGNMSDVFAYNSSVSGGKADSTYRSIGNLGNSSNLNGVFKNVYQYHTILDGAGFGLVNHIVTDDQINSKAFYENHTTMDFGGAWHIEEGEHPTLSFAPYKAEHTFTQEEQTASQFAGGSGSIEDPFLISTPAHLKMVAKNVDAHFKLVNDIDMDWAAWTEADKIGKTSSLSFKGTFDGNGYTIKNLNIVGTSINMGLFGYIGKTGVVKNLKIENVAATSTSTNLGILAGAFSGRVENVKISNAEMTARKGIAGFIAADTSGAYDATIGSGVIKNVFVEGTIDGEIVGDYLGGIVGKISANTNVDTVYSKVTIINGANHAGGFAGAISERGAFLNIVTTGDVQGKRYVGGYAGSISVESTHQNIFTYGAVSGAGTSSSFVGGVIGSPGRSILNGIYAYNESVSMGAAISLGNVIGNTNAHNPPQFVTVYEDLTGGHSNFVTGTATSDNYNVASTYSGNGMSFNTDSAWAIDVGGAPYLKAFPEKIERVGAEWVFSNLVSDDEYVALATTAIDLSESTLTDESIDKAQIAVNDISKTNPNRNVLQKRLDAVKLYKKAIDAVGLAEKALTQGSLNDARIEVSKLDSLNQKNALMARLDAVQATVTQQNQLAQVVENLVLEAERLPSREIVASTTLEVEKLSEGNVKLGLLKRLNQVTHYLDVLENVESSIRNVESNISFTNARALYKETTDLVANASRVMDVSIFGPRLQQAYMDIQIDELNQETVIAATNAVVTAENVPTLENVEIAQGLIDALPDIEEKVLLQERLDAVKALINKLSKATEAVEKVETTLDQTDYDNAFALVEALPASTDKTTLQNRLKDVLTKLQEAKKLAQATESVEKAEGTKIQADVDNARNKVNSLPNGDEKTALINRLDVVQAEIDAQKAIEEATEAVVKAETTKTQVDVDNARTLVNALPTSDVKTDLTVRLDAIQTEIDAKAQLESLILDATQAVETAESTKKQVDVDNARILVNALPDGAEKTNLTNRLDAIQAKIDAQKALADATQAVVKAEGSKSQADVDDARILVNALPDGTDKTNLTQRLDVIQAEIDAQKALADATQAVVKAEGSKSQADVDNARTLVNALPDGADKTALTQRLNAVQKAINDAKAVATATQAVVKAEGSKAQADIDDARILVNALPDGADKTKLTDRLDAIQAELDRAYNLALQAVEKAEGSTLEFLLTSAQKAVDKISDNDGRKAGLQDRLDVLYKAKELREVETAVARAERSPSDTTIANAQALINKLDQGDVRDGYQARLDVASKQLDDERYAAALREVVKTETNKTRAAVQAAQEKVDLVKDSERKTALQERLDAILEWIEYVENLDGKFLSGDNIVEVAKTVKDENVSNYLVEWANSIDVAERYYSMLYSSKPAIVLAGIPESVLADVRYQPLINELKARTNAINKARTEYVPLRAMAVKAAYNALYDFENDRTQAKYDAALSKINALQTAETGDNTRKAMLERLNRIQVKK